MFKTADGLTSDNKELIIQKIYSLYSKDALP